MSAVPPSNGKSTPFLLILTVWATPAIEHDVAARDEGPAWPAGSKAAAVAPAASPSGPTPRRSRRRRPRTAAGRPSRGREPTARPRRPGGTRAACDSPRGRRQRRGVRGEDEPLRVRRPLGADGGQDRVGLAIRRAPARRTSCSSRRGRHSTSSRPGPVELGPEVGHRHDRDVADGRGARGRRLAWAPPAMGSAPRWLGRGRSASGSGPGRSGRTARRTGVSDPTSPPPTVRTMATARTARTVTRGSRFTAAIVTAAHRDCPAGEPRLRSSRIGATAVRAKRDCVRRGWATLARRRRAPQRAGSNARERGAQPATRPASSRRDSHPPQASNKRTPRPGGRTGRREIRDGGPDRIRTGDLQRDRLACWAATPRVRCSDREDST